MAGVGLTPSLAMAAEDIRDLQGETSHEKRASGGRFRFGGASRRDLGQVQTEPLQRARHVADRVDGDARIERGRFELGVSEQNLDDPDIDVLFQQMGCEAMALIPNSE
jgi:hypothetical protein